MWTSYAQFADWGICLARPNPDAPKRKGITFFVVDMHAPGVEVRPLVQLTGEAEFNEVFLDDVFVPDDQVVGEIDSGWSVANSTLSHERGTNPRQLVIHCQLIEELLRLALANGSLRRPPHPAAAHGGLRRGPALPAPQLAVDLPAGQGPRARPGGQLAQALLERDEQAAARGRDGRARPGSPLWFGADGNPGDGVWQRSWLYYQASSIWAGTNEIQRTIIGERVLGLPRP